ncbi:MFS transporter [Amycolatopsis lurida]
MGPHHRLHHPRRRPALRAPPPVDQPDRPHAPPVVRNRRWPALVVVLIGQFMASLDTTIGNVAAPSISRDLQVGAGTTELAVAAYTLLYASFLITGARLGADRGRRKVFLIGITVFTIASTAAGAAPTGEVLIGARAAQGLGAALAIPQAISFIQADFTGRARARALATYGAMISFGASIGLAAGGLLIDLDVAGLGWRTVFLINLPLGALVLVLAARMLPPVPPVPRRLDMRGVSLLTTGAALLTGALALGPVLGWPPASWAALAAGTTLLAVFAWWQRTQHRRNGSPLLDPAILSVPGMRPGLLALLLSSTTYTGILYCVAAELQVHHGSSPLAAGIALLPFAAGFGAGSALGSLIPPRRHRALILTGLIALSAALVTLAALPWHAASATLLLAIAGLGYGAAFSPLLGLTVAHVDTTRIADASGIATTTFQFSFVIGVAAFGGLFTATTITVALAAMGALALLSIVPVAASRRTN